MVILVDADGVIENLTEIWTDRLNEKYGINVRFNEDFREWDMTKVFTTLTPEQIYTTEYEHDLYKRLTPYEGAPETLKRLIDEGHTVLIVTHTPYQAIEPKMEYVIKKYFPFLTWRDFILTAHKQMIRGDVLIDDGVHNLLGGDYAKILYTQPYNEDFDAEGNGMVRVHNWKEVYEAIRNLMKK